MNYIQPHNKYKEASIKTCTQRNEVRKGQNGAVDYQVTSWSVQLFKGMALLQQQLSVVLQSLLR